MTPVDVAARSEDHHSIASDALLDQLTNDLRSTRQQLGTLSSIIEMAPLLIFWKDRDLQFQGGNPRFVENLGYESIRDIIGKTDADFFPHDDAAEYSEIDRRVIQTGEAVLNRLERQVDSDGNERLLRTSKVPFRSDTGHVIGLVGVSEDVTDLHHSAEELRRQAAQLAEFAAHDDLTGLPNRRTLHLLLESLLEQPKPFGLMFVDLDDFKVINDSLGHETGDRLIIAIGERLHEAVPDADLIARLGGDEFAILIDEHGVDSIETTAHRVVRALRKPIVIDGAELYSSASVGVTHRLDHHRRPADVLRDADLAMYEAKGRGRARYEVFNPKMFREAAEGLEVRTRVSRAVRSMDFSLHYQPIIDAADGRVVAVEALLRMPNADGTGLDSPALFLPHLETTGLILPVGDWIINEACRQLSEWRENKMVPMDLQVHVNLSPLQFRSKMLTSSVMTALAENNLPPGALTLEVTESAVADNPADAKKTLERLRASGITIAMDDFGVGQSSLSLIGQLPFDEIKIDKTFVDSLDGGRNTQLLLGILRLIETLDLHVVAEGVETEEQANWLAANGCHRLQGYFLGRPAPANRPADSA